MASKLKKSPKIRKLALDLGIRKTDDPVSDIILFCHKKVKKYLKDHPKCKSLKELLEWVAGKANTVFEEIHDDEELEKIKIKYLKMGEKIFVNLDADLSEGVYGITYKRTNRDDWEHEFISIIDCRGNKVFRAYFTKWHEIAHLLVLTDQMRLSFMRTDYLNNNDPEEAMVDIIAGEFSFYKPITQNYMGSEISFEAIDALRDQLCPEASQQVSLIGFVKAMHSPCMLLSCKLGLRKDEQGQVQESFDYIERPQPALRANKVTLSDAARKEGFRIFPNMRIPKQSVIYQVFKDSDLYMEAHEKLSWWEASNGMRLPDIDIVVKVKRVNDSIYALVTPAHKSKSYS